MIPGKDTFLPGTGACWKTVELRRSNYVLLIPWDTTRTWIKLGCYAFPSQDPIIGSTIGQRIFLINLKGINHRDVYFLKLSVKTPFRRSLSSKRVDFQPPRINGSSGNSCPGGIAAIAMVHSRFVSPLTTLKCLRQMCLVKFGSHFAHEIKIGQMKFKFQIVQDMFKIQDELG